MSLVAWIFSLGGVAAFLTMLFHSIIVYSKEKTAFIFIGGSSIAYLLEYTLSNILEQYYYQNIPLTILSIPIVIPLGWVITFYGLYHISLDISKNEIQAIYITGLLGMIFGIGIESMARHIDFWVFNFDAALFIGIPIKVIFAWGFSTANFSLGIYLFDNNETKKSWLWLPLLSLIHVINVLIAIFLIIT